MRVVSGTARGRKLRAPDVDTTRPITDRAKEGIFNMLGSLGGVEGLVVADLWAGSGSFGIEALSRGAERAIFVERGREALRCLSANLESVGFADRARVVPSSVEAALAGLGPIDLAFCDPPYADDPWDGLLESLHAELIVGHAERPVALGPRWEALRRRRYGRAHIVIARPAGTEAATAEPVVAIEAPSADGVVELLEQHLALARSASPPEHVHALDLDDLAAEEVLFHTVREPDGQLLAVGALRLLDDGRAEIKSMHTAAEARGRGVGRLLLRHLVGVARERNLVWVGLETGTMDEFAPARALYLSEGFLPCPPFGPYTDNSFSLCMSLDLDR